MVIKKVTQLGSPLIRGKAKKVLQPKQAAVQRVVHDLIDSMRYQELVGMAAPQIGQNMRIFVTEVRKTKLRKGKSVKEVDPVRVFINPTIIKYSKQQKLGWEGCGSVASSHLFGKVKRPSSVTVKAFDEKGNPFVLEAQNLLARIIQHECDHLNGVVFTDRVNPKTFISKDEYVRLFTNIE